MAWMMPSAAVSMMRKGAFSKTEWWMEEAVR